VEPATHAIKQPVATGDLLRVGETTVEVAAGKRFEVAYWTRGKQEILSLTCPDGRKWSVYTLVKITETDA